MARIDNIINVNSVWNNTTSLPILDSVTLKVWVYSGIQGNDAAVNVELVADNARPLEPTYTLKGSSILNGTDKVVQFDIAPLIRDYVESELNQSHNTDNAVWVDLQATTTITGVDLVNASEHFLALDGYEYTMDVVGNQLDEEIRISNRDVQVLDGEISSIPVIANEVLSYKFMKDGVVVLSENPSIAKQTLLQPTRSNVLTYSEEFDNAAWVNNGVTITANQITSPTGSLTADLLTGVSGGFGVVRFSTWTSTNNVASCFAKKGSSNIFKIGNVSGGSGNVTFDLENGTVGAVDTGFEGSIEDYGNGWYRCTAIDTLGRTGTFALCVTAASESVYIWGAQLEQGDYASSYIQTSGSTVQRDMGSLEQSNEQILYISNTIDGIDSISADSLEIETTTGSEIISINEVEQCRYESKKITFVNRLGAFQDIWFFANSKRAVKVKADSWNRRNLVSGGGAYRPTTIRNVKSVNETHTLNSGFYPESNNVVFEELIQSENVWITKGIETFPIIIKNSSFNFKDSNTDKMINYTMQFEYAFNKMRSL